MVITSVTPIIISAPEDSWAIVSIKTDTGLTGWGEFSGYPMSNHAVSAILNTFSSHLIGKNPLRIEECLSPITQWRYPSFLDSRMMILALSALDMALWDITAKDAGVPLSQLLGTKMTSVSLYGNLNRLLRKDRSIEKLKISAVRALESGLKMVKVAPFDEVTPLSTSPDFEPGLNRFHSVAKEVGTDRVSLDCHCRFTPESFDSLVASLGGDVYQIPFIEDPVRIHWAKDIIEIYNQHPTIIYASGEDCFSKEELFDLAQSGMVKILNPDLKYIGGISGCKAIIPQILESGVKVSLHNPSGPIATAFSAHASTLCGDSTMLEYAFGCENSRNQFVGGKEPIFDGVYLLNDKPGIGIEPDPIFIETYGQIFKGGI